MHNDILNDTGHTEVPPLDSPPAEELAYFAPLVKITTNAATPFETSYKNIEHSVKLGYPRLHELAEFQVVKGVDKAILLVGGGPSLNDPVILQELREMAKHSPVVACGSVYDWLIEKDIIPDYCTVCDPDPLTKTYMTKANQKTLFLLSTACDPEVFEALKNFKIALWHCYSDANAEKFKELEPNFQAVGGGCTVGLRSISIAILFGYSNIHMFGFDSSLSDDKKHHAYDFIDDTKEFLGDVYSIRMGFGGPGDKLYKVAGYQIAQAEHFKNFFFSYHDYFTPTFHGSGLLPDMYKMILAKSHDNNVIEAANRINTVETVGVAL